jgi:hypothetical protein
MRIWTLACGAGWLLFGLDVEQEEARCRAEGDFLCADPGLGFLLVGIPAVGVWVVGALVIAVVRWARASRRHTA